MSQYCMVLTTVDSQANAELIAQSLLREKLAACVQIQPIESYYSWQGGIEHQAELMLRIKTRCDCYERLQQHLLKIHPYDVPQIIQVPIMTGLPDYLAWLDENCLATGTNNEQQFSE
ncbi:divalent-cation tolerance protein CutA [Celerinatantimonas diazotrophica]|uniref:Periplasmic divalent cation tolerance protein n=1 Tax=Celerinatantimonas diazotrophica TaxID=412034 RepID=A0A4R1JLF9_9GAMM|nr:divalent-cation tolerance protein CutA [Celerinatantimonas diazotrophica]TCK51894.1 periplasmic divalent cation tolerance protein [Celerinatantimonas diazotrophica]CAG9296410.1 Divalent-cation tolerance protein CutA [Celerinatantimonas diazotrophica]